MNVYFCVIYVYQSQLSIEFNFDNKDYFRIEVLLNVFILGFIIKYMSS